MKPAGPLRGAVVGSHSLWTSGNLFFLFESLCLYSVCVSCVRAHAVVHTCRSTVCRRRLFPSAVCVPGLTVRSSGMMMGVFTLWAILWPRLSFILIKYIHTSKGWYKCWSMPFGNQWNNLPKKEENCNFTQYFFEGINSFIIEKEICGSRNMILCVFSKRIGQMNKKKIEFYICLKKINPSCEGLGRTPGPGSRWLRKIRFILLKC